jgi:hypothetical protein
MVPFAKIYLAEDYCIERTKRLAFQLFLDQFFKNAAKMPSSNTSSQH